MRLRALLQRLMLNLSAIVLIVVGVALLYSLILENRSVWDILVSFFGKISLQQPFAELGTEPYLAKVADSAVRTLVLVLAAVALSLVLAFGIGVPAALGRGGPLLRLIGRLLSLLSYPPCLALGMVLLAVSVLFFGFHLSLSHEAVGAGKYALMVLTLAVGDGLLAEFKQHIEAETRRIQSLQYLQFSRVLGLPLAGTYVRELTLATIGIISSRLIQLIGGVIVIEILFNYPGMGWWCVNAINNATTSYVNSADEVLLIVTAIAIVALLIREFGIQLIAVIDPRRRPGATAIGAP